MAIIYWNRFWSFALRENLVKATILGDIKFWSDSFPLVWGCKEVILSFKEYKNLILYTLQTLHLLEVY